MTRTAQLLEKLGIEQQALADWLGVSRSVVSRLKTGAAADDGPVSRMLDHLDGVLARDGAEAARALVLSGALSPEPAAPFSPNAHQAGFGRFS